MSNTFLVKFWSSSCGICGRMAKYDTKVVEEEGLGFISVQKGKDNWSKFEYLAKQLYDDLYRMGYPTYILAIGDDLKKLKAVGEVKGGSDKGTFRKKIQAVQAKIPESERSAPKPQSLLNIDESLIHEWGEELPRKPLTWDYEDILPRSELPEDYEWGDDLPAEYAGRIYGNETGECPGGSGSECPNPNHYCHEGMCYECYSAPGTPTAWCQYSVGDCQTCTANQCHHVCEGKDPADWECRPSGGSGDNGTPPDPYHPWSCQEIRKSNCTKLSSGNRSQECIDQGFGPCAQCVTGHTNNNAGDTVLSCIACDTTNGDRICYENTGECRPGNGGGGDGNTDGCTGPDDCPSGWECQNGTCVFPDTGPPVGGCHIDEDCPDCYWCDVQSGSAVGAGYCTPLCDYGVECIDGKCEGSCEINEDCLDGLYCKEGVCVDGCKEGYEGECDEGYECKDGVCVPIEVTCPKDWKLSIDCPAEGTAGETVDVTITAPAELDSSKVDFYWFEGKIEAGNVVGMTATHTWTYPAEGTCIDITGGIYYDHKGDCDSYDWKTCQLCSGTPAIDCPSWIHVEIGSEGGCPPVGVPGSTIELTIEHDAPDDLKEHVEYTWMEELAENVISHEKSHTFTYPPANTCVPIAGGVHYVHDECNTAGWKECDLCSGDDPDPCADHDCRDDQICVEGRCECPAGELEIDGICQVPACIDDSGCGDCEKCEGNKCVSTCRADQVCKDGACVCPDGSVEVDGKCVTGDCVADGDCSANDCQKCVDNKCTSICRDDQVCDGAGTCKCPDGSVEVDGKCVVGDCVTDGDCDANDCKQCVDNKCVSKCRDDQVCDGAGTCKCPDGYVEVNGQCIVGDCVADGDCSASDCEECVNNQCTSFCGENEKCDGNGTCICADDAVLCDGVCKPNLCIGKDCEEGLECDPCTGECFDPCDRACCGLDEICIGGECFPDPCWGKECPEGEVCKDGDCIPDPCIDKECPDGEICEDGICVENPCYGVDCPPAYICEDGDCVPDRCFGCCEDEHCDLDCEECHECFDGDCYMNVRMVIGGCDCAPVGAEVRLQGTALNMNDEYVTFTWYKGIRDNGGEEITGLTKIAEGKGLSAIVVNAPTEFGACDIYELHGYNPVFECPIPYDAHRLCSGDCAAECPPLLYEGRKPKRKNEEVFGKTPQVPIEIFPNMLPSNLSFKGRI